MFEKFMHLLSSLSLAPSVSECNRTYYGEVGKTYRLTIPRPRADKLPFVCSLNLVANQYEMGDFVQVCVYANGELAFGIFIG